MQILSTWLLRQLHFVEWHPIFFSIITAVFFLHIKMCTHISSDGQHIKHHIREVHKPLQNCRSSVWNLLHVTLLAPRICRWLLHFWKMRGPPVNTPVILWVTWHPSLVCHYNSPLLGRVIFMTSTIIIVYI